MSTYSLISFSTYSDISRSPTHLISFSLHLQSISLIQAVLTPSPQTLLDSFRTWFSTCLPSSSRPYHPRNSEIHTITLHFKDSIPESPYEQHLFLARFPLNSLTISLIFTILATVQLLLLPM